MKYEIEYIEYIEETEDINLPDGVKVFTEDSDELLDKLVKAVEEGCPMIFIDSLSTNKEVK